MKVGIISLGCDKNRVDAEYILAVLKSEGYEISNESKVCDILIINTCAFIESARAESIDAILEYAELKNRDLKKLIVAGCLSQKYAGDIFNDLPEVDAFIGPEQYQNFAKILQKVLEGGRVIAIKSEDKDAYLKLTERVLTTPIHYAYLKIAEGCNNACSYCTIPSIKGKYRSKELSELVNECKSLNGGFLREIILVAQDVTRYGCDLYGGYKIVELIKELSKQNIKRIRLLYCYPELITDELILEIKNNDKVCKYLDIPFQHISDNILKNMRRRSTYEGSKILIEKLRSEIPGIAIRSTFITGFPGEREEDFNLLYNFLSTYKLESVGFFKYSCEEGTLAAKMPNQIPEEIKEFRFNKLYELQQKIAFGKNENKIGKTLEVLCDGFNKEKNLFFGRTYAEAPEVDGVVYLDSKDIKIGEFYDVRVKKVLGYDLLGDVINKFD